MHPGPARTWCEVPPLWKHPYVWGNQSHASMPAAVDWFAAAGSAGSASAVLMTWSLSQFSAEQRKMWQSSKAIWLCSSTLSRHQSIAILKIMKTSSIGYHYLNDSTQVNSVTLLLNHRDSRNKPVLFPVLYAYIASYILQLASLSPIKHANCFITRSENQPLHTVKPNLL